MNGKRSHRPVPEAMRSRIVWLLLCSCGGPTAHQGTTPVPPRAPEELVPAGDPWVPGDPGAVDISFVVNTNLDARPISPLIYGTNVGPPDVKAQRWGVIRAGGNRATAYNWENNASNAGADWQFQNDASASTNDAPAEPLLEIIDAALSIDAPAIITLSNADFVSADKKGDGDVRRSGPDYLRTRFKINHPRKGAPFATAPDPNDAHVYQDELVAFLKARRPKAKLLFAMDNEPELWSHTHAEIFSRPVTYADLWRRNAAFARAAKDAWRGVEILGPVSFGYSGYIDLQGASDAAGRNFLDWYLGQARAAERADGTRLIDYLDVHWYPEAQGAGERITSASTSRPVVIAREQAPRSLWDPTYNETSWVRDKHGGPIALIPWLQAKIDRYYPGTKLAITEWNYGAGNHISGAVTVADVLGIFGRFGVSIATYWHLLGPEPYALAAFRAFRNYDGEGSAFGDTAVAANSSEPNVATIYATTDSTRPERTVVIVINKEFVSKRAGFRISHGTSYRKAQQFVLSDGSPMLRRAADLPAVASNAFRCDLPAQSVSVIVPQP